MLDSKGFSVLSCLEGNPFIIRFKTTAVFGIGEVLDYAIV